MSKYLDVVCPGNPLTGIKCHNHKRLDYLTDGQYRGSCRTCGIIIYYAFDMLPTEKEEYLFKPDKNLQQIVAELELMGPQFNDIVDRIIAKGKRARLL